MSFVVLYVGGPINRSMVVFVKDTKMLVLAGLLEACRGCGGIDVFRAVVPFTG